MKTGLSLIDLAKELERQADAKRDFIAPTNALTMVANDGAPWLHIKDGSDSFGITATGHQQIAEHAEIPRKYYDRMLTSNPALLATNVNAWFATDASKRMLRTLDGKARALRSDRFRPLDNDALAEAILPPLVESGAEIVSCQITESRFYLKAVDRKVNAEIMRKTGHKLGDGSHVQVKDVCCPALTISNSEIGAGSLAFLGGVFTGGCSNLAFFEQRSTKRYHIGGHQVGDAFTGMLSDATRRVTDAAFWMQARDLVKAVFEEAQFAALVTEISETTGRAIEGDPVKVVELAARKFGLGETERASVLRNLITGGDLTQYGLHAAITRAAEDLDDYDRASEFERIGGQVIELPANDWQVIARAA